MAPNTIRMSVKPNTKPTAAPVTAEEIRAAMQSVAADPAPKAAPAAPVDPALKSAILQVLEERDAQKKKADAEKSGANPDEGHVVGSNLNLQAHWSERGLTFTSPDKDFDVHIGGRLMGDAVFFRQSNQLKTTTAASGLVPRATGDNPGIGDLTDGFFMRRIRVIGDGTIWQVMEYRAEMDLENYNLLTFDELFVGAKDIPFFDTIRVGQCHVPFGLEAYSSSRFLPMMERSPLFDAFYQEFAPGIFWNKTMLDGRMTMQHMFHRIDNFSQFTPDSFGDGRYAYSGRISGLPIYENDGRCLLHLGLAYQWRKGANPADFNGGTTITLPPATVTTNTDLVRFRSRQGLRDAIGAEGDGARIVDTGNIIADNVQAVNAELLAYWGSAWVQAEACATHVGNAFYPASNAASSRGNLDYWGAYVQTGYFLTGEQRGYDQRFGKYSRVRPLEPFFLVRSDDGHFCHGWGAWELQYRFAYLDLTSDTTQGGLYTEHTVGLNWYWSDTIKLQANYIYGHRSVGIPTINSGFVQGLGLRFALEF
jgi:phosphate-selective porin OprO/OprP